MPTRDKDVTNDRDLKEIRQQFEEDQNQWQDSRDEAKEDMKYLAGDPWDDADKRERKDAGRPCVSLDELNQYTNQTVNNIRQNKRDGQLIPKDDGANEKDAELRADAIRGNEFESNAQQAYLTALQNAVERSYGFARILTRFEDDEAAHWDQSIRIVRCPNPDVITIDPDYQEADASDIKRAFVLDLYTKERFRRRFPRAKFQTFGPELMKMAPNWIRHRHVQVAEFWKVKEKPRKLLLLETGEGDTPIYEDELHSTEGIKIKKAKTLPGRQIIQQIVNGVEILDETTWLGSWIPILCCFGKELFVDDGTGPKRVLLSQVRLARDPQMLLAYLESLMCELAGLQPKTPYVGYKGQFDSDAEAWEYITKIARAYVEVDPIVDQASGQVLPIPKRETWNPQFGDFVAALDLASRKLQSAMGIIPLPTAAQRLNEKSGVAIQRIQSQEAIGSYHFVDSYDQMLRHSWRIQNELLSKVIDTPRHIPRVQRDGKVGIMRVNDPDYASQYPEKPHLDLGAGNYGATIVVGPNEQSEREAVSDFVDNFLPELSQLGLPPAITAKVVAIAIRMRNLGAKGEQLAEIIDPPQQNSLPPAAQAAIAQKDAQIQQLQQELAALLMEKKGKVLELATKERIADKTNTARITEADKDRVTKVAVAEVETKAQVASERQEFIHELEILFRTHAHEAAMQAAEQTHQRMQAAQAAQAAAASATPQPAGAAPGQ